MLTQLINLGVVVALFAVAWLGSRAAAVVARRLLSWHDRRNEAAAETVAHKLTTIKRRETTVAVIRAGIAYAAFAVAVVLSVGRLSGGFDRISAAAGASFLLILAAFAVQRLLTDLIAGVTMFVERWYAVGDTIAIPTLEIQGVVEDVSLRRTKLRTLQSILPEGPTAFVKRPSIEVVEELSETLVRIRMRATVAPGREWLVEGFVSDLLKERAKPGLIVHGPVVLSVDESAARSFARASAASRWGVRSAA